MFLQLTVFFVWAGCMIASGWDMSRDVFRREQVWDVDHTLEPKSKIVRDPLTASALTTHLLIVAGKARVGTRSGHPKLGRFLCNHVVWCSSMRISPFPGLSVLEA